VKCRQLTCCIVQGILLELPLAGFFLKKLLRRGCDLNDLPSLDAELHRSLLILRDYDGDVEDLALSFTLTDEAFGANCEVCHTSCWARSIQHLSVSAYSANVEFIHALTKDECAFTRSSWYPAVVRGLSRITIALSTSIEWPTSS
jgi:hypothetical protein